MKNMKTYIFMFILFIYSLINKCLVYDNQNIINLVIWIIVGLTSLFVLGNIDNQKRTKKKTIKLIISITFIYLIINSLIGIFIGFNSNNVNLYQLVISLILVVSMEIGRYCIIKHSSSKTLYLVIILFTIFYLNNYDIYNILNVLTLNILLTYMSSKVGSIPSIIYSILYILNLYLPCYPAYQYIISSITTNILMLILAINLYRNDEVNKYQLKHNYIWLFIIIPIVCIVAGFGRYRMIGIVSNSMIPNFKRGDAIIYKKIDSNYEVNLGDILIYNKDGDYIVHRVVKKSGDYIYTKGDNNVIADLNPVSKENYIGIYIVPIPYMGYPFIWLENLGG